MPLPLTLRIGARDFAKRFYKSKEWQRCQAAYAKYAGGLCERCKANGIIRAGVIVHHKVHLTPENINDPAIALSWSNLKAVCRECHAIEHGARVRRYEIDRNGRVMAKR